MKIPAFPRLTFWRRLGVRVPRPVTIYVGLRRMRGKPEVFNRAKAHMFPQHV